MNIFEIKNIKMFKFLKDLIAPKKCYSCKKEWHFLCEICLSKIKEYESICYYCKWKTSNFDIHKKCLEYVYYDKVIILAHYENKIVSKLVKDLKFHNKKDITDDFSNYLSNIFFNNEIYKNTDEYILLYPPMSFLKKLKRWYNHSEILAEKISKLTGIKIERNIIKKVKSTRQQSILSREERLVNLLNSFKISKNKIDKIDNKIVIIVDDVISTWSTLNELSKILKHNWVKKVIWLIISSK